MEKETYTAYDLEPEDKEQRTENKEPETAHISENSENSENSDNFESSDNSEISENSENPAKLEIDTMIAKMGAETLLQIIKDNRNAAISQIMNEIVETADGPLPSGVNDKQARCNSIFDLASLA